MADKFDMVFQFSAEPDIEFRPRQIQKGIAEIEIITAGTGLFSIDEKWTRVQPGNILWFSENDFIFAKSDKTDPYECLVIRFVVPGKSYAPPKKMITWKDLPECMLFCKKVLGEHKRGILPDYILCNYAFSKIIMEFHLSDYQPDKKAYSLKWENALQIIDRNYRNCNFQISKVHEELGITREHLHYLARRHGGKTPFGIVLEKRLSYAKQLMMTGSLSIKEISETCGFGTFNHFCRAFRKNFGVSPGAFRSFNLEGSVHYSQKHYIKKSISIQN